MVTTKPGWIGLVLSTRNYSCNHDGSWTNSGLQD